MLSIWKGIESNGMKLVTSGIPANGDVLEWLRFEQMMEWTLQISIRSNGMINTFEIEFHCKRERATPPNERQNSHCSIYNAMDVYCIITGSLILLLSNCVTKNQTRKKRKTKHKKSLSDCDIHWKLITATHTYARSNGERTHTPNRQRQPFRWTIDWRACVRRRTLIHSISHNVNACVWHEYSSELISLCPCPVHIPSVNFVIYSEFKKQRSKPTGVIQFYASNALENKFVWILFGDFIFIRRISVSKFSIHFCCCSVFARSGKKQRTIGIRPRFALTFEGFFFCVNYFRKENIVYERQACWTSSYVQYVENIAYAVRHTNTHTHIHSHTISHTNRMKYRKIVHRWMKEVRWQYEPYGIARLHALRRPFLNYQPCVCIRPCVRSRAAQQRMCV